jgi:hypothetical protein
MWSWSSAWRMSQSVFIVSAVHDACTIAPRRFCVTPVSYSILVCALLSCIVSLSILLAMGRACRVVYALLLLLWLKSNPHHTSTYDTLLWQKYPQYMVNDNSLIVKYSNNTAFFFSGAENIQQCQLCHGSMFPRVCNKAYSLRFLYTSWTITETYRNLECGGGVEVVWLGSWGSVRGCEEEDRSEREERWLLQSPPLIPTYAYHYFTLFVEERGGRVQSLGRIGKVAELVAGCWW